MRKSSALLVPFILCGIITFPDVAALSEIVISEPVMQRLDGSQLVQTKSNSQVILSVTLENKGNAATPYVTIVEVRDSNGVTTYLQYQKGTITSQSSTEVGISWTPSKSGDYKLRTFVLSDLTNPIILSPVMQSEVSVGFIDIELNAPRQNQNPIEEEGEGSQNPEPSLTELRQYALQKINDDRKQYHLPPVELSLNEAAQIHAEDVFRTKHISHWMTNGEKPYMTYSRYDGTGDVAQNVGVSGDKEFHEACTSGEYLCHEFDPFQEIESHQYGMMYEDEECCDNGHRDNILDKYHTHVSIGIAYDDYFFVIVQNFENQYIEWEDEIDEDNPDSTTVTMVGSFIPNTDGASSNDVQLSTIGVYYDPLPTNNVYQEYYDRTSYGSGEFIAAVVEPLNPGWYYEQPEDYDIIEAEKWRAGLRDFEIEFSLENLFEKHGDGVYTIIVWCEDKNDDSFTASGISLFLND